MPQAKADLLALFRYVAEMSAAVHAGAYIEWNMDVDLYPHFVSHGVNRDLMVPKMRMAAMTIYLLQAACEAIRLNCAHCGRLIRRTA